MVLSRGDDFPIHQTPEPIAFAGTDRNFYDRYFFNGYAPDGSGFFALAFGVYPHLDLADAHFSFIRDGKQYALHASTHLNMERIALRVGPIAIEVIEPLQRLKVTIDECEGIEGEFTFDGRAFPIAEPRFTHRIGPRAFMDYSRMTQNGHYAGWIALDGARQEMIPGTLGTRDRSWGVRPIGARDPQPMPDNPIPQFFWQWTPLNVEGGSIFFHINADGDGAPWNTRAVWAADGAGEGALVEGEGKLTCDLIEGSRWPASATLDLNVKGAPSSLRLSVRDRFQMKGIGYTHPSWGHGVYQGALKTEREEIDLAAVDPAQMENRHVQMICAVEGDANGTGIFEQLILGPYGPLGLHGI